MTEVKRPYRSVSQLNQYARCPQSYKLARIDKVWQRPAAWLPQGSAVHTVCEVWRIRELAGNPMTLHEAKELFGAEYEIEVEKYAAQTPNLDYWFRSGPYGGMADIERRYLIGLEQVEKFVSWTEGHPGEAIWISADGVPGIELAFDIELEGIPIRGFIDAVIAVESDPPHPPMLVVRDYKTGNSPGDDFQLGVYGVALSEMFGIEPPQLGDYYMAGKKGKPGKPTHPYNIAEWTRERVAEKFLELEENLAAERFDPDPSPDKCGFCDVALSCAFSVA